MQACSRTRDGCTPGCTGPQPSCRRGCRTAHAHANRSATRLTHSPYSGAQCTKEASMKRACRNRSSPSALARGSRQSHYVVVAGWREPVLLCNPHKPRQLWPMLGVTVFAACLVQAPLHLGGFEGTACGSALHSRCWATNHFVLYSAHWKSTKVFIAIPVFSPR